LSIIAVIGKRAGGLWRPFQERAADEATLRKMFAKPGVTGLAVITGRVSRGLACRDFDREGAYHHWAAANPDDASTLPTVRTHRGFHVYGQLYNDTYQAFADGELRADTGHYCLLPPSAHPDGGCYAWVNDLPKDGVPIPAFPSSLSTQRIEHSQTQTHSHPPTHIACVRHPTGKVANSAVEKAILRTLPDGPGQRNRKVFELAKALKGIMSGATGQALRTIVAEWHRRATPAIRTKDFTTTWLDFVVAWERIRAPEVEIMATIVAKAKAMPTPAAGKNYDSEPMRQLVALCATLQQHHGSRPWPLSCRKAGEIIGVSHDTAARMLKALRFDRVIELAKPAGKRHSGQAAEYRYHQMAI
jgi:hypothetical protein